MKYFLLFSFIYFPFQNLESQVLIDSLILKGELKEEFSWHNEGQVIHYLEDSIYLVDFQANYINKVWSSHGIRLDDFFDKTKNIGLNRDFCRNGSIHKEEESFVFSFNYNWDACTSYVSKWSEKGSELNSYSTPEFCEYTVYNRQDYLITFSSEDKHKFIVYDKSNDSFALKTMNNESIYNLSNPSKFSSSDKISNVNEDFAVYVYKEASSNFTVFCKMKLSDLSYELKQIKLPDFIKTGNFNNLLIDNEKIYLIYTKNIELNKNEPNSYQKVKSYLIEVDLETEVVRNASINELLTETDYYSNSVGRIFKVGSNLFITLSRQIQKEYNLEKDTPILNEVLLFNQENMVGKNIVQKYSKSRQNLYIHDGKLLTRESIFIGKEDNDFKRYTKFMLYQLPKD